MTITLEQLEVLAPAAFSDSAADHVSKRYNHVRTADVVEHLLDAGFEITHATQQKTQKRSEHKASNQKHRIRMRMPYKGQTSSRVGQIFPSMDLVNSGDWSSNLIFASGLYRFICENGMIAPFGNQNTTIKTRHDRIDETVMAKIEEGIQAAPALFEFAEQCADTRMSPDDAGNFAKQAARIRFDIPEEDSVDDGIVTGLLQRRRSEDAADDLWGVFNSVQENGTHGGFRAPSLNGRLRRVRARSNIGADMSWNQNLWELTQSFANRLN